MVQVDGHSRVGTGLIPRGIIAAVDYAAAADFHVICVGNGDDRMQYRASGKVERLIILQGDGVYHPFAGPDVKYVGIVGVRHVGFQGIGEDVQGFVHIAIKDHGVLPRLGDEEGNDAVLHLRFDAPGIRLHHGAFHCLRQPRHFNADAGRAFKVKIRHGRGGGKGVGVPDVLVIHHHVVHEQVVPVHSHNSIPGCPHGFGPFVEG